MTPSNSDLDALWRVAFVRCRTAGASPEDAQDCAQDAIAELLARSEVDHPKAWVATVAHHRYVDVCRLRRKERSAGLVPGPAAQLTEPTGPEELVVGRAHARWLVSHMRTWPTSTHAVCSALAAGRARAEIGDRLGLTGRAVESHLTRARRLLRGLSLLGVAIALAVGRWLRTIGLPAGKPVATAAWLGPSVAAALVVGSLFGSGPADHGDSFAGAGPPTAHPAPAPVTLPPSPHPNVRPRVERHSTIPPTAAPPDPAPVITADVTALLNLPSLLDAVHSTEAQTVVQPPALPAVPELVTTASSDLPLEPLVPLPPPSPQPEPLPALPDLSNEVLHQLNVR